MPVFISESANLRVGFPPERFGLGNGWEEFYDSNGNLLKKRAPFPAVKFFQGSAEVDDVTAQRMRAHEGFGSQFRELPAADVDALANMQIGPSAKVPPGGLTDKDVARLQLMEKIADKSIGAQQVPDVLAHMQWAVERLNVTGFHMPDAEKKPKVVRAALLMLLDQLGEHGIEWNAEPEPGDTGDGTGTD